MPRTPIQLQAARDQRQAAILQAALVVFARHGYAAASVRMIAQEAGIALGLLYNYFPSKEAVLTAIMEQSMAYVRTAFAAAHAATTPNEQIEHLIRCSFVLVEQHQDFWRLSYSVRMMPDALTQLGDALHAWIAQIVATLEQHLAALGVPNPQIEATLLFAQIDGVAQHYTLQPTTYPLEAVVETLVARYRAI